jgi:hypothetical protein
MSSLILCFAVFAQADLEKTAVRIVWQTNDFREQQELAPVTKSPELQKAAKYFADYLAEHEKLDHEADGSTPAKRAEEYGYDFCIVLENIASKLRDPDDLDSRQLATTLLEGWQESKEHRVNLLDLGVTQTGVAVARSAKSGRYYAVQMFGRPKSSRVEFTLTNESNDEVTYELDGKELSISGQVSRVYSACALPKLIVHLDDEQRETFSPEFGEQVVIVKQSGALKVERRSKK